MRLANTCIKITQDIILQNTITTYTYHSSLYFIHFQLSSRTSGTVHQKNSEQLRLQIVQIKKVTAILNHKKNIEQLKTSSSVQP